MKNVYVVLDNDMENCLVTTDVYSTYEKAKQGAAEVLAEVSGQYDKVEKDDQAWLLSDGDIVDRVVEIQNKKVM